MGLSSNAGKIGDTEDRADTACGWYLYGIIQQPPSSDAWASTALLPHNSEAIQILQHTGVAAVVRSVRLADYEPETLRAHMRDADWLETMARHHHRVIESIHRQRPILPATFGCVYPDADGLRAALSELREALLARLAWVADCDEWTVHLYAESNALKQRLTLEHPGLQHIQREIDSVPPGRAYLLKRKLAGEIENVMDYAATELAEKEFGRIRPVTRAGMVQTLDPIAHDRQGELEILRAVFLVPRPDVTAFQRAVEEIASQDGGIRAEYSGPWPPYSFARLDMERDGDG